MLSNTIHFPAKLENRVLKGIMGVGFDPASLKNYAEVFARLRGEHNGPYT
jgi:hypothetical protein